MLMATAGARLFISGQDCGGPLASSEWIEISDTESLGTLGVSWSSFDVTTMESGMEQLAKGRMSARVMQVVMGNNLEDAGQMALVAAVRSFDDYAFRLLFPNFVDGQPAQRFWRALVMSLDEAFDEANGVIKLMAELQPTTPVSRDPDHQEAFQ